MTRKIIIENIGFHVVYVRTCCERLCQIFVPRGKSNQIRTEKIIEILDLRYECVSGLMTGLVDDISPVN